MQFVLPMKSAPSTLANGNALRLVACSRRFGIEIMLRFFEHDLGVSFEVFSTIAVIGDRIGDSDYGQCALYRLGWLRARSGDFSLQNSQSVRFC